MEVIARLQDRALCADMSGSEIPVRSLSRQPGVGINRVQAEQARRRVPSATFLNTGVTRPGFGPSSFGAAICLYVLIGLPRECCRAWRNESPNRSGIEKHGSPGRT
jgi:hypothetical protein